MNRTEGAGEGSSNDHHQAADRRRERGAVSPPGLRGTGIKQIVTEAQAPFGSLYHHFPGGKEQLGAEAIRASGAMYEQLIPAMFDPAPDPPSAVRDVFAGAASTCAETDYADACPIATVSLEVSSTSETMRDACAEVFESWIDRVWCSWSRAV